jgi:serine/threonine protein phosphatase PrpC
MNFNVSAFTHIGTERESNQDNILVNGQILSEGEVHLFQEEKCVCFVADGVGGNKAGDFASHFVLEKLKLVTDFSSPHIEQALQKINNELLSTSNTNKELTGTATTLTGLVIKGNIFHVLHAGDSQMWLLRNDMFFQITKDHVMDESEKNSSITSYFGGKENFLRLDSEVSIHESMPDDIFLICSDGLYKSINQKIVKSILKAEKDLETKAKKILENCLQSGAEDNISVILIKQTI